MGCAPARPALHVWKPSQPPLSLMLAFLFILFIVPWTRDAGRAGAHPYHATRCEPRRIGRVISRQPPAEGRRAFKEKRSPTFLGR